MTKYRIVKKPGELYPYQVQRKAFYGWRPLARALDGSPNYYQTQKKAEAALDNLLERQNPPIVVNEIDV